MKDREYSGANIPRSPEDSSDLQHPSGESDGDMDSIAEEQLTAEQLRRKTAQAIIGAFRRAYKEYGDVPDEDKLEAMGSYPEPHTHVVWEGPASWHYQKY